MPLYVTPTLDDSMPVFSTVEGSTSTLGTFFSLAITTPLVAARGRVSTGTAGGGG